MIAGLYPHRLQIWRDTGQRDRLGQRNMEITQHERGLEGMAPTGTDIRCRLTTATGSQRFEERSQLVFVTTHTVFCDSHADVREQDRIRIYEPVHNAPLVPDGIVTLIRPVYAMHTLHHLELKVQVVRGPQDPPS